MRRRSSNSIVPAEVQMLEDRALLSGAASVTFAAGVLTANISGGGKLRIDQLADGRYKVSSANGYSGTLLNGRQENLFFTGVQNVIVNMAAPVSRDLKNVVRIGNELGALTKIPGDVTVNMGGDYNRLYFENVAIDGNVVIQRTPEGYVDFEAATVGGTITYLPL